MDICKEIDKLGRLVIPVDLRKTYGFKIGDKVYLQLRDDGILIRAKVSNNDEKENDAK